MPSLKKFIQKRIYRPFYVHIPSDSDEDTVLLSGVARGGTTWFSELINYDNHYRYIFEPFHPYRCNKAKGLTPYLYLPPDAHAPEIERFMQTILSGRVRERWTDRQNHRFFSSKRLIKGIHSNLFLGWLKRLRPGLPTLLLHRHPVPVALSWEKLGWVNNRGGYRIADTITDQAPLLGDWPIVGQAAQGANFDDSFEQAIFVWCVLTHIPRQQLEDNEVLTISYEKVLGETEQSAAEIFDYLGRDFDLKKLLLRAQRPSKTTGDYRDRKTFSHKDLLEEWRTRATDKQVAFARDMVNFFGLDDLYSF